MILSQKRCRTIFTRGLACVAGLIPCSVFARGKSSTVNFGVSRGLTFYTSPELAAFNSRLGNSPRLSVGHEFGRAITHAASYEFLNPTESASWGFELQQWGETLGGNAVSGEGNPRSEATLAFVRAWITGGLRLWPWVGPVIIKRNTNILGHSVVMSKARTLSSGLFSHLRLGTGPLLWRHDFMLSDEVNQTEINYASRSVAWEGGVRWTLGWRLSHFCDVGMDLSASRSIAVRGESAVGEYYLAGRDNRESGRELEVENLSRSAWRTTQLLMFVRFFYP